MLKGTFIGTLGAIFSKLWLPALIVFLLFCFVTFIFSYRSAKRRAKALESFERENAKDKSSRKE